MKRAEVWQKHAGRWRVNVRDDERFLIAASAHPTHAEALTAALEAVGLTPANPEPMEAP